MLFPNWLFQDVATKSIFSKQGHDLFNAESLSFDSQDLVAIMKIKIYFVIRKLFKQNINNFFCLFNLVHICFKNFDHCSSYGFVVQSYNPRLEIFYCQQFEIDPSRNTEQWYATAQDNWIDIDPVLVDQVPLHKTVGETRAPKDHDVLAWPLL